MTNSVFSGVNLGSVGIGAFLIAQQDVMLSARGLERTVR
jgi:hypothetical protein